MRIGVRLGGGFAAVTALLVLASGVAVHASGTAQATAAHAKADLTATRELKQFQLDGESVALSENSIGFDYNSHSDASDDLDHFNAAVSAFTRDSLLIDSLPLSGAERDILANARSVFWTYVAQSRQANRDFAEATPQATLGANALINGLAFVGVTGGLNKVSTELGASLDRQGAQAVSAARFSTEAIELVGLLGVLCALALSVGITRSIVGPLRSTVEVLDAISSGDLSRTLGANSDDEIGHMGRALNRTVGLLRRNVEDLTVLARTDPLTGLANRAAFNEALGAAVGDSSPSQASVLFIDLDDFKKVNDTLGHQGGDAVLVEVAARMRLVTRPGDLCARLGGDEFAILLAGADTSHAKSVADRIVAATAEPIAVGDQTATVGASVGVAACTGRTNVDELIKHADAAMYTAKARGKSQIHLYTAAAAS